MDWLHVGGSFPSKEKKKPKKDTKSLVRVATDQEIDSAIKQLHYLKQLDRKPKDYKLNIAKNKDLLRYGNTSPYLVESSIGVLLPFGVNYRVSNKRYF